MNLHDITRQASSAFHRAAEGCADNPPLALACAAGVIILALVVAWDMGRWEAHQEIQEWLDEVGDFDESDELDAIWAG
jgi:hypothetical protein